MTSRTLSATVTRQRQGGLFNIHKSVVCHSMVRNLALGSAGPAAGDQYVVVDGSCAVIRAHPCEKQRRNDNKSTPAVPSYLIVLEGKKRNMGT